MTGRLPHRNHLVRRTQGAPKTLPSESPGGRMGLVLGSRRGDGRRLEVELEPARHFNTGSSFMLHGMFITGTDRVCFYREVSPGLVGVLTLQPETGRLTHLLSLDCGHDRMIREVPADPRYQYTG